MGVDPVAAIGTLATESKRQVYLCQMIGLVDRLIFAENEDGSTFTALGGMFRAICKQEFIGIGENGQQEPNPEFDAIYESGVCYLPPGTMQKVIAEATAAGLVEPKKTDARSKKVEKMLKDGARVKFAYDIYVQRAANPSGRTYVAAAILPPGTDDPMAEIQTAISAAREETQKLLAAKSEEGGVKLSTKAKQIAAPKS